MQGLKTDRARQMLCDLIAMPTVNPMGQPYDRDVPVERPVIEYLEQLFEPFAVQMSRQSCSCVHENLVIRLPGKTDSPATLLESHIDTVPADDWGDCAFMPRIEDGKVLGRGACDDKGSLTAMVLALLQLLEHGRQPQYPVTFVAAADEEYAQTGIKHMMQHNTDSFGRGVFGEPTGCKPVIQHKGTIRWDVTVFGKSAHTSRTELGRNAIYDAIRAIDLLRDYEQKLQHAHQSELMTGPTLTVTTIQGGRTRNAVPDQCTFAVDLRVIPGMDPAQARDGVISLLQSLDAQIQHSDVQLMARPLDTSPTDPFVQQTVEICSAQLGRPVQPAGAAYGTDAACVDHQFPAIVLGPGDAACAHAIDENIELAQVHQCTQIYKSIMLIES